MSTKDAIERLGAADVRLASVLFSGSAAMSYDAAATASGGSSVGGGSTAARGSAAVYTLEGEARGDSADGRVLVALEGEATTGDGEQAVEMDCSCKVLEGQQVIVTVTGTHPVVTDVIGWGDGMQEAIDAGNEAIAEVDAAVQTVDAKAVALLAQLGEDEKTLSEVHGALEDSDGRLIASADVVQSVAALRSTMEADYQTKDAMGDYSTTLQMQSAIEQSADAITTSVSKGYVSNDAIKKYSTTAEMNTAISQSATDIKTNVLKDYATTSDLSSTKATLQSSIAQSADAIRATLKSDYLGKSDASATYQTQSSAKQASDAFEWSLSQVRGIATGEGDELVANPLDGTSGTGWSPSDSSVTTVTKSGVTLKGTWGTSSAVAYKNCIATLTSAASGTAAYARSIDVSATVRVNAASTDAGRASARVSVRYVADGATATSTLTAAQLYLDGATAGTKALAGRVTLPAGATIKDVAVSVPGYGGTADVTFSQVHARISACGLGGDNLMTGTAGFSTLSGGTWANGGLTASGTGTLAAASSDGTPVPESACVALAGTSAGERMQLHQPGWSCAAGEALTVSCWAKASAEGGLARLMAFGSVAGGTAKGWYVGTSWTRLTYTQTTTAASDSTPIGVVQWYPKAAGDKLYVCGLKVERGGVASAWCTSPDDLTQHMRYTSKGLELSKRVNGAYSGTRALLGTSELKFLNSKGTTLADYGNDGSNVYSGGKLAASYKADGVHLYDAGTEVASFGTDSVELGKNSTSSSISFCGKKGNVAYRNDGEGDFVYFYAADGASAIMKAKNATGSATGEGWFEADQTGKLSLTTQSADIVMTATAGDVAMLGYRVAIDWDTSKNGLGYLKLGNEWEITLTTLRRLMARGETWHYNETVEVPTSGVTAGTYNKVAKPQSGAKGKGAAGGLADYSPFAQNSTGTVYATVPGTYMVTFSLVATSLTAGDGIRVGCGTASAMSENVALPPFAGGYMGPCACMVTYTEDNVSAKAPFYFWAANTTAKRGTVNFRDPVITYIG